MPSFPWPDYWIPLPATGSGPPVLRRRWSPVPSRPSASPRDCWTPAGLNGSAAPVLERHCTCATPWTRRAAPAPAPAHHGQTETPARKSVTLPHSAPLPDAAITPVPGTVTATPPGPSAQTITRLCLGCGKPLEGMRPQAKAHGVACRQRAYRRRKKEARLAQGLREKGRGSEPQPAGLARTTPG